MYLHHRVKWSLIFSAVHGIKGEEREHSMEGGEQDMGGKMEGVEDWLVYPFS